jgi:hypothetical protein
LRFRPVNKQFFNRKPQYLIFRCFTGVGSYPVAMDETARVGGRNWGHQAFSGLKKESTMLKKLVVGAIAAGVLAVPLAGVAGAVPDPDTNPGVPGNFPGGIAPGQRVRQVATAPKTVRPPGTSVNDIAQSETSPTTGLPFANVGDAVNDFAPPNFDK